MTGFLVLKILLSATLTHDPEPLKRFRLNFPRLFLSTTVLPKESAVPLKKKLKIDEDETVVEKDPEDKPKSDGGVGTFSTPSGLKVRYIIC